MFGSLHQVQTITQSLFLITFEDALKNTELHLIYQEWTNDEKIYIARICSCSSQEEKVVYAASTGNQGIEAYWSRLKKFHLCWWIDFFSKMVYNGMFRLNLENYQECLLFCFLPIIQKELSEFTKSWNLRFVRQSLIVPAGKFDLLFEVPSLIGYPKKGAAVQESDIGIATDIMGINHYPVYKNKEMNQFCNPACVFR